MSSLSRSITMIMATDPEAPRARPIALVTGAGKGIGRAIAVRLARDGADTVINFARDEEAASGTVAALRAEGCRAMAIQADVTDTSEVDDLFTRISTEFGAAPSIVVNNVGEFSLSAVRDTSDDRWRRLIDSNLNSAFFVSRRALPGMRLAGHGRIVFIGLSPALEVRGAPNIPAYAVAKTGVTVLTRCLAAEEAPFGITVNCVAPGLIDNGFLPPEQAEWMKARVPAGRLGTPEEVADAVAYVTSERAGYVSGATLSVSGGWEWDNRPVSHDQAVQDLFEDAAAHV
ncbi:SDR family NAD(P)-dependent oxidoreductase [Pseudonocardia alni]|uniref:SDR family NAD(P)-dependent oxidoreductase n=1 Tax=Pseudonocardia alni TaxID=33907 RepID=UPI00280A636B|nr:SDR family NAD(P)-dependent oxidoreductase [Pseudonocardia alni]